MGHLLPVGGMSEVVVGWEDRFDKLSEFELERVSFFSGEKYALLKENGKYNCGRCGCTLYTSKNKFIPHAPLNDFASFREPAVADAVTSKRVYSFGMKRTEALCGNCHLHLGYVFPDGVASGDTDPSASERHCILSFCLKFIPDHEGFSATNAGSNIDVSVMASSTPVQSNQAVKSDGVPSRASSYQSVNTEQDRENILQTKDANKQLTKTSPLRILAPIVFASLFGSALFYWVYKSKKE